MRSVSSDTVGTPDSEMEVRPSRATQGWGGGREGCRVGAGVGKGAGLERGGKVGPAPVAALGMAMQHIACLPPKPTPTPPQRLTRGARPLQRQQRAQRSVGQLAAVLHQHRGQGRCLLQVEGARLEVAQAARKKKKK